MHLRPIHSFLLLVACAACSSPSERPTERDARGNYATTSDYNSMMRSDFMSSMHAGLADFDEQMVSLRTRANDLGGESLQEFADCSVDLQEARESFVNQLEKAEASLVADWPDRRDETVEQYDDLREKLQEAYDDVLKS